MVVLLTYARRHVGWFVVRLGCWIGGMTYKDDPVTVSRFLWEA